MIVDLTPRSKLDVLRALAARDRAIKQHCDWCEPDARPCREPDCPLRAFSPKPLGRPRGRPG